MKFTIVLGLLGACVIATHAITVDTFLNNLVTIGNGVDKIDALVKAYPKQGGTVNGALVSIPRPICLK